VLSLPAATLDTAAELAGATELAGVELGAIELAASELTGAELAADEGAGLLPPPPPPPQAVKLRSTIGKAQVLIRDCIVIPILRYCYGKHRYWVNIRRI
jgi:hypothetical protein